MKWICSKQIQKITYFTDNICNKEIKQVFTFHCNKNEMMKKHQEKMHKIRRPLIFSDAILRLFFPLYDLKLYLTVITELAIFSSPLKSKNGIFCHDSIYLGIGGKLQSRNHNFETVKSLQYPTKNTDKRRYEIFERLKYYIKIPY